MPSFKRGSEAPMDIDFTKPSNYKSPFCQSFLIKPRKDLVNPPEITPLTNTPKTPQYPAKIPDSSEEEAQIIPRKRKKHSQPPNQNQINFLEIPHVISSFVHAISSLFAAGFVVYMVIYLIWTIRTDLMDKAHESSKLITQQIETCSKNYQENKCWPDERYVINSYIYKSIKKNLIIAPQCSNLIVKNGNYACNATPFKWAGI
jgi:uncharacterized CHY-type Zn-finger protein